MRAIVAAIHGIMTSQTETSWPDKLASWMWQRDPEILVIKKEYRAGPFPKINCLIKDPVIARGLAAEIVEAKDASPLSPIWIVAHSNGAVIALKTAKILISRGYTIAGLILTGAACEADVNKSGVAGLIKDCSLRRAVAFCADDDSVLAMVGNRFTRILAWPYGDLGRVGWQNFDVNAPLNVAWFTGGHSTYFTPQNISETFARIHRMIKHEEEQRK